MPDKGRVMSQNFYEKQSQLIKLYKESFLQKEIDVNEAITALRVLGFGEQMAANRVREWALLPNIDELETEKSVNKLKKKRVTLEKYAFSMILDKKLFNENDKKYINEYRLLKSKYKDKKLSKDDCVTQLINSGYNMEFAEYIVEKWEE